MTEVPPSQRRLLHVVIDGLGDDALTAVIEAGHAPTLLALIEAGGVRGRAISPYPSLTPVCLSTLATGALPDVHRIPSLAWFHRGQRRFVEYGSSYSATGVEGTRQSVEDVVFNLNHVHLAEEPPTIFELLESNGLDTASINHIIFRGRHRHTPKYPVSSATRWYGQFSAVYGPKWFWYGELFGQWRPVMPQLGVKRPKDMSASRIARWLVRSTDASYILLYLGEHDKAAHAAGPMGVDDAVRRADRAIGRVIDACGGMDEFLRQWGIIVCADHGQVDVADTHHHTWSRELADWPLFHGARLHSPDRQRRTSRVRRRTVTTQHPEVAVAPSNRCAMFYRLTPEAPSCEEIAERVGAHPSADVVSFRDGDDLVVQRDGERLVLEPDVDGLLPLPTGHTDRHRGERRWALDGSLDVLDLTIRDDEHITYGAYPDAIARLDAAHGCVNAGDVIVSATPGWEYTDIGGIAHRGGSHGSLHGCDSTAAFLALGVDNVELEPDITLRLADIYSLVGAHFGLLPGGDFAGSGVHRGLEN